MQKASLFDLQLIAECHQKAFPNSVTTLLGKHFISEMFKWYLLVENRFLYCIIENEICMGYFGGYVVTPLELSGSGSGMAQSGFYAAVISILKKPYLLFHPEIVKRYVFICKNILFRIFYLFTKNRIANQLSVVSDLNARLVVIGVHPDFQGKEIGSILIKKFEFVCNESQVKTAGLSVHEDNKAAIHFYKKNGWKICGKNELSLKMEKTLDQ